MSLESWWNSLLTLLMQKSAEASRFDRILIRISMGNLKAD